MKEARRYGVAAGENEGGVNICCQGGKTRYFGLMDWQQIIALVIVVVTAGIFLWSRLKPRKFNLEKDTHCGCSNKAGQEVMRSSIVFRARKGERPQITVKMN